MKKEKIYITLPNASDDVLILSLPSAEMSTPLFFKYSIYEMPTKYFIDCELT